MECRDKVRSYQSRGNCSMMCCTSPVPTAVHIGFYGCLVNSVHVFIQPHKPWCAAIHCMQQFWV